MDLLEGAALYLAIRETGSLRRTAERLGVSAAAVSRRLDALEALLGVTLLHRTTRRLVPTDAGERFRAEALKLLAAAQSARDAVRADGTISGRLVISASVTYGLLEVGPAIDGLLRRNPGLQIELRLEDRLADLLDEGVDLAIRGGVPLGDSADLIARPLRTMERWLVAAPGYLRARGTPQRLEELSAHDFLGGAGVSGASVLSGESRGRTVSVPLTHRLRTRNLLAVRDAALRGRGVALLPDLVAEEWTASKKLRRILREVAFGKATVHALHRVERRGDPAVRALLDVLSTRRA